MTSSTAKAGTSRPHSPNLAVVRDAAGIPNGDIHAKGAKNDGNGLGNGPNLVDASVLADFLGVSRAYVYEHATELGAIPLGAGPKPRLRFDRDFALDRLSACTAGRESEPAATRTVEPKQARRRRTSLGSGVELLPIRGPRVPRVAA